MATIAAEIPTAGPQQNQLQTDPLGLDAEARAAEARDVAMFHRRGKEKRRYRDLTAEKYLIHLDGEGDGQYADIVNGSHVAIPPNFGKQVRVQWNLLRPIVANMVKHHTSIPFRATVDAAGDRKSREKARVDAAFANHTIRTQRLNQTFAEALWLAAAYGHCPVHFQWRDDTPDDLYQPLYLTPDEYAPLAGALRSGFVDAFVGDPWDTIYNDGATRTGVHRLCYARSVPLALVQNVFRGTPGAENLRGRRDLPSASRFQKIARRWMNAAGGLAVHGTAAIDGGADGEELIVLLCDELAPGLDARHPQGRLRVVALVGQSDTDQGARSGDPVLLHDGPLPGRRFSCTRVYSTDSFDDVLGRPFVADLDDLQIHLNQLATLRVERIRRFARTQLLAQAGGLEDDTLITVDDAVIYYNGERPAFLAPPQAEVGVLDDAIADTMDQMFRIGGWQAASRGEGKAGDAAAKVVALANADDSIFASSNAFFQQSVCEGLQTAHALAKQYMTLPMLLQVTGSDHAHIAAPWIRASDLSDRPPAYELTQGSASPEAKLQQLMALVQAKGSDGAPLMTTAQFHEANPDPSLRPPMAEVERARRTRPLAVNAAILAACEQAEAGGEMPPEWLDMAAQQMNAALWREFRIESGDDPQLNIDALDELILDESMPKLPRAVARLRRQLYAQWQAQLQQFYAGLGAAPQQGQPGQTQQQAGSDSPFAGSPTSNQMAAPLAAAHQG